MFRVFLYICKMRVRIVDVYIYLYDIGYIDYIIYVILNGRRFENRWKENYIVLYFIL